MQSLLREDGAVSRELEPASGDGTPSRSSVWHTLNVRSFREIIPPMLTPPACIFCSVDQVGVWKALSLLPPWLLQPPNQLLLYQL